MISVVLPTLWKIEFNEQLNRLHQSNVVGEILLINNDRANTPSWYDSEKYPKIVEIIPHRNIFVNPAWNMGVRMAKYENIMLQSDDVVSVNYDFLTDIDNQLQSNDCLIGVGKSCYDVTLVLNRTNDNIKFHDISNTARDIGFGCMMFFRKNSYKHIPDEYLVWRGDDLLIDLFNHRNKQVLTIVNQPLAGTKFGTTVDLPEFSWKEEKEGSVDKYNTYLTEYLKQ